MARGLDNRINGDWQDCLSALSQDRVDELTGELRNGVPASLDPSEFVKRYGVTGVSPGSVEWKLLQRELAKAERTIAELDELVDVRPSDDLARGLHALEGLDDGLRA